MKVIALDDFTYKDNRIRAGTKVDIDEKDVMKLVKCGAIVVEKNEDVKIEDNDIVEVINKLGFTDSDDDIISDTLVYKKNNSDGDSDIKNNGIIDNKGKQRKRIRE